MSLPNYRKPPLNEVVFGVYYDPVVDFKAPHIGIYWNIIRDKYPKCVQMPPIGQPTQGESNWPFPLPRVWFISEDDTHLIQLQNGRFYLNWRRQSQPFEYPRYENLIKIFQKRLEEFTKFIRDEKLGDLGFSGYELTYINHVYYNHLMQSSYEINNIFPDIKFENHDQRFLRNPALQFLRLEFPLPEDYGHLLAELKYGKRTEEDVPLFLFQLSTKGFAHDNKFREWYDLSHEWIVKSFSDLTSLKAQKELWELIE